MFILLFYLYVFCTVSLCLAILIPKALYWRFSFFVLIMIFTLLVYTKTFEFHHFWCYSLMWRWEIAVHSEMPMPRGVVELWSVLRACIDRACKSPQTNHTQPRIPQLADECGRPWGALFILQFSNFCTFVLLLQGWVRALSWRHFTPSPLLLSACFLCLLLVSCSFFKNSKCQSSQLSSLGRFALCLNLSCAVFILPYEEPQRAKSSFVDLYALHLHHIASNFCCLKSCLVVTVVTGTCGKRSMIE